MAFILTYTNLVTDVIPAYLERNDPEMLAQIPVFVDFAQRRLSRDFKSLGLTTYVTGTLTPAVPVYQKPNGWANTMNINVGSGTSFNTMNSLELRQYTFITEYWPDRTQTGFPKYFSDYGYDNWLIAPTPDLAYPFEVSYLGLAVAIDASHPVNWVTEFSPDLLVKATLLEAMIYLKNDQRREVLNQEYNSILSGLKNESRERMTDQYAIATKSYQ